MPAAIMSAVQFIFRGGACWRGGEEFRAGFNLSAGWARKDRRSWLAQLLHWCCLQFINRAFLSAVFKKLHGKRKVQHQHPPFWKKPQVQTKGAFDAPCSCKLPHRNLPVDSLSFSVDHKPLHLRCFTVLILSRPLFMRVITCPQIHGFIPTVVEVTIYGFPCYVRDVDTNRVITNQNPGRARMERASVEFW